VNEHEKGRRIARYLDDSLDALDPTIVRRLETARSRALAALPDREIAADLALTGGASGRTRRAAPPSWTGAFRILLPATALLFAMVGTYVWQEVNTQPEEAEMDLLADELPIDAYLDKGFQQWISASLEQ